MSLSFDHVGLSVADLDGALAFYTAAFGFDSEFAFELTPHPVRGAMMRHPSGARLELFEHQDGQPGPIHHLPPLEAHATHGFGHFAMATTDLDAAFAAALSAGATAVVEPRPSPEPGVRFAFLSDPEGNLVELVGRG